MANDIDAFLDAPDNIDAFLDAPTKTTPPVKSPTRKEVYATVADNQGFFENLMAGAGGAVEGWRLGLKQLLGRSPTDEEVKEYQDAVAGLRGTWGGAVGEIGANLLPGVALTRAVTAPAAVAGLMTKGGIQGALANVGIGGATGALEGAVNPVTEDQSRAANVGMGGLFGGLGAAGAGLVTKAGSLVKNAVMPYFSKGAAQVAGGKILQNVAGEQSGDVIRALRAAQPSATGAVPTAGQAVVGAGVEAPQFAATQAALEKLYPSNVLTQQQAARQATLKSFAGDEATLKAAEEARDIAFKKNIAAARQKAAMDRITRETVNPPPPVMVQPQTAFGGLGVTPKKVPTAGMTVTEVPTVPAIESLRPNKVIQATMADARRMASNRANLPEGMTDLTEAQLRDIIKDPMKSLEGLQMMKAAIDYRFKNPQALGTSLSKVEDQSLTAVKNAFVGAVDTANQLYGQARKQYAQESGDILQMRVGQRLQDVLEPNVGTTERRAMFAKAVNDETQLLRKSGGFDRADLETQMKPDNMAKINAIVDDLNIDTKFNEQVRKGVSGAEARKAFGKSIDLPNLMNSAVAIANGATRKLTGRAKEKTLGELAIILRDPKATADIMEKATKREQNAIKFLMRSMQTGAIAGSALTEAQMQ